MRIPLLILLAAAAAWPAAAQNYLTDLHEENRLLARTEQARQRALAAEREAMVSEARARTAWSLDSLGARRVAPSPFFTPSVEPAPLDPGLAAQVEAVANAQAKALEQSNARLRAISEETKD